MSEEENNDNQRNPEPEVVDPEDTIKILLATDCHLGYERSTKRAQENDSLVTFEEILQLAVKHEVDFILLGGDLFHDTKPPQDVVSKCIELLRKYCLGSRDVKIQLLTDPDIIFEHCEQKTVNFEDPNLNISIPVFSIHGNHDDPSSGTMGSLDLLSSTGFINYFGKWMDLSSVNIPPLILKKGNTYISIYGLSYIADKRLARLIRDGKFKMLRATEIPDCFNMFVLHQNRVCHGNLNNLSFIKEENLPEFLDFIMWGHEHECQIKPTYNEIQNYVIFQPGSSVATSLSEGEAVEKHVGLLSVNKKSFELKALKLKTVRPFVIDTVRYSKDMEALHNIKDKDQLSIEISKFADKYIETEMIRRVTTLLTDNENQPKLPLIRLKVIITNDDQRFDLTKLAQKYYDQVANPMDMITFTRESHHDGKSGLGEGRLRDIADLFICNDINDEREWNKTVQAGICSYFEQEENKDKLSVLSVAGLNEALALFTETDNIFAFEHLVNSQVSKVVKHLETQDLDVEDDEEIKMKIKEFQMERMQGGEDEEPEEVLQLRRESQRISREHQQNPENDDENDEDGEGEEVFTKPTGRGRGRGGGRGGRGRDEVIPLSDYDDEEELEEIPQPAPRGRGRGRARATVTTRGRGRGRAKVIPLSDYDDEGELEEIPQPSPRGRGRGRARATVTTRGRGRATKQSNSTIDITRTPSRSSSKASTTSKAQSSVSTIFRMGASQNQARDDEFVDSD